MVEELPVGCVWECRGCRHRGMTVAESLQQKYDFLHRTLSCWSDRLQPVRSVSDSARWGYRTKTTLSARFNGKRWVLGMWRRDELIPIPNCPIHHPRLNKLLNALTNAIPAEERFSLAYVVVSGAQVVLVIKSKELPSKEWFTDRLAAQLSYCGVEGVWYHANPSTGRRIFQKGGWELVWGTPRSYDANGLLYGPAAFQQLIPELYNGSLLEAKRFFMPDADTAVVDLYCGTGNSMRVWERFGASILGVELGGEAVECARINIPSATVLRGACRHRVPQIDQWALQQRSAGKKLLLYANPPRTGLEKEVLQWITGEGKPRKIAYLSCSPGTLSRNLLMLTKHAYRVEGLIPFDFFPQTRHVETLALLERV